VQSRFLLFDQIVKLLKSPERAPRADALQVAVAVFLVEAAQMDDTFEAKERAAIETLLAAKFELSGDATKSLLAHAEDVAKRSNQLHPSPGSRSGMTGSIAS
jgi:uncharacterized tellurite resistance protein B-like protein